MVPPLISHGNGDVSRATQAFFLSWRELAANAIYIRAESCQRPGHGPGVWRIKSLGQNQGAYSGWKGITVMGRVVKLLIVLLVLAFAGLSGYAYLADLSPRQEEVTVPVTLNAD
jgi:hypothetical protein